jgi:hypothetical protein
MFSHIEKLAAWRCGSPIAMPTSAEDHRLPPAAAGEAVEGDRLQKGKA